MVHPRENLRLSLKWVRWADHQSVFASRFLPVTMSMRRSERARPLPGMRLGLVGLVGHQSRPPRMRLGVAPARNAPLALALAHISASRTASHNYTYDRMAL
jgi:hypothetical protein